MSLESLFRSISMADLECPGDSANNCAWPMRNLINLRSAQYRARVLFSLPPAPSLLFPSWSWVMKCRFMMAFWGRGNEQRAPGRGGGEGTVAKIKSQETSFDICPFCSRIARPDDILTFFILQDYKSPQMGWWKESERNEYQHNQSERNECQQKEYQHSELENRNEY